MKRCTEKFNCLVLFFEPQPVQPLLHDDFILSTPGTELQLTNSIENTSKTRTTNSSASSNPQLKPPVIRLSRALVRLPESPADASNILSCAVPCFEETPESAT